MCCLGHGLGDSVCHILSAVAFIDISCRYGQMMDVLWVVVHLAKLIMF